MWSVLASHSHKWNAILKPRFETGHKWKEIHNHKTDFLCLKFSHNLKTFAKHENADKSLKYVWYPLREFVSLKFISYNLKNYFPCLFFTHIISTIPVVLQHYVFLWAIHRLKRILILHVCISDVRGKEKNKFRLKCTKFLEETRPLWFWNSLTQHHHWLLFFPFIQNLAFRDYLLEDVYLPVVKSPVLKTELF